jgi:beta-phosphoglucomutase
MRAIVFDSDGVLVDSMPSHFVAWKIAFKEVCNSEVDKRTIYLLEGMRGIDLVKSVFELKKYHFVNNEDMKKYTERVIQRKDEVFREILLSSPPKAYLKEHFNIPSCRSAYHGFLAVNQVLN